ncbi:DUF2130 domain-containing protein [Bradyrhizobium sp. CB1717]|uniref:DUF2130 domain-containing protein n=1 Tax=Bradyrhizobium sp. CB1717 TaxID=3039154 RepID=UPI0024B1B089|nr:DUF2130 domain-containing protein [Bradyrhizobium sp. CB1717]WFU24973.1 DUF2130 domain-containing protein [Bradyrhizobium sp. CB1717]
MLESRAHEPHITCPKCNHRIRLTESLAAPLLEAERRLFRSQLDSKDAEYQQKAEELRRKDEALDRARSAMDAEIAQRVQATSGQIRAVEQRRAQEAASAELDASKAQVEEMRQTLTVYNAKLAEAQQAQAEVLRRQRELAEQKRELDLLIEKRVQATQTEIHIKARQQAEDELMAQVSQKDAQIESMSRTIEDLKRKALQGSQQTQGEALELQLEALLRSNFPNDLVEPVGKGELGGDIVQTVNGQLGNVAGTILWELKATKKWNDGWLAKLREDQRNAKADIALIISHALPKEVETFGLVDGVWVAHPRCAIPVAIALRHSLTELASLRKAQVGQQTKMEHIYQYLVGPRFRQRVEGLIERFEELKNDLSKERKFMNRIWAKRESQIHGVIAATAGMYGDLQGIAGTALPEIDSLDRPLLEAQMEGDED